MKFKAEEITVEMFQDSKKRGMLYIKLQAPLASLFDRGSMYDYQLKALVLGGNEIEVFYNPEPSVDELLRAKGDTGVDAEVAE